MNTKGKEKKEKSSTASEREATESKAQTPAREYYQDSKREPKTKSGKAEKNLMRKFIRKQAKHKVGCEAPRQKRTSRKARRKRRAACNDIQSYKTKRLIGKKTAGEWKQKTPEERQTRKKNKEKKRLSQYPKEDTDRVEEKSEQSISEYGDQNTSQSSLTGEKEEDTEANVTKRENQVEPTTGEPNVTTDKAANIRKQNYEEIIKKARKTISVERGSST